MWIGNTKDCDLFHPEKVQKQTDIHRAMGCWTSPFMPLRHYRMNYREFNIPDRGQGKKVKVKSRKQGFEYD